MANKAPATQLYFYDLVRDLEEHPLEITGAWILILAKLWYEPERGKSTKTIEQWSKILRIDAQNTKRILDYIKREKIGDVTERNGKVTERNGKVTVVNRRMYREYKAKVGNKLRQQRFRGKRQSNAKVTRPSSSSSSSSSIKENIIKESVFFKDGKFHNITDENKSDWAKAYPAVDIDLSILQAAQWLISNPTKTKKNYRRFLTNWFNRTQEKGGNKNASTQNGPTGTNPSKPEAAQAGRIDFDGQKSEHGITIKV